MFSTIKPKADSEVEGEPNEKHSTISYRVFLIKFLILFLFQLNC